MKPADVAWPLRERNSLEISTRVEGTKHVQVGRDALTQALDAAEEILTPKDVEGLRAILKAETGWDKAKRAGLSIIPQGTAAGAAQSLVVKGKSAGLFIVPVGELERFVPAVGGHGPAWVNEVLARRLHESPSPEAASFITDIDSFASQV